MELPKYVINWLYDNAFKFPNVIGFSQDFSIAQIDGDFVKSIDDIVRFYVTKKVDIKSLLSKEIIPSYLAVRNYLNKYTFETDVVELGEVMANPPIPLDVRTSNVDKTANFRPVELGVSIGNEAISAGSLGMLYEVLEDNSTYGVLKGDELAGSNAHVVAPNALWTVDDVKLSMLVNVLQRGVYHGGTIISDVIGSYLWHKQVRGLGEYSTCPISIGSIKFLNGMSKLFGRKSRFKSFVSTNEILNTIDFGLYKPSVEHKLKIADDSIDTSNKFGAHLFAGSEVSGVLFQISEALKQCPIKIRPKNNNYGDFKVGDIVKGCSFWCNYETDVIDVNGVVNVRYGNNNVAPYEKCVIVNNDGTIKGGWSGSGWFKV